MRRLVVVAILTASVYALAATPPGPGANVYRWIEYAESLEDTVYARHIAWLDCQDTVLTRDEELLWCRAELWRAKWEATNPPRGYRMPWYLIAGCGLVVGVGIGAVMSR